MFDQNMAQNFDFDSSVMGNNNIVDNDMNVDINMMNYSGEQMMQGGNFSNSINEGVQEKCIHRTFVHEVPQV